MRKPFIIAVREYLAIVRTKAFLFSLLAVPLVAVVGAFLIVDDEERTGEEAGPRRVAIVDGTGEVASRLAEMLTEDGFETEPIPPSEHDAMLRRELFERVRARELAGVVEVDAGALDEKRDGEEAAVRLYTHNPVSASARWLRSSLRDAIQLARFEREGIGRDRAEKLLSRVRVSGLPLPEAEEDDVTNESAIAKMIAPFICVMLLFLAVMSTAPQLLQAVIEEKQQRIAEVLLGAASPSQIMTGKLLGTTGVGLTVLAIYVGGGAVMVQRLGYGDVLSPLVVGLMVLDVILALVMFGSLFLAIGATANDIKDAQGLLTPVMIVLMLPLMTLGQVMRAPDGALSTGLSLFPLTAPLAMPLRLGAGAATPTWHVVLAVALVAGTTALIVWAAGRVFRIGMLAQGQAPGLRELWRWIVRG